MRKITLVLLIFTFAAVLFVLYINNSLGNSKEISSIEIIRQSDKTKWTLSDKSTIDKFAKALNDKKKTNAKIDIRSCDYSVTMNFKDTSSEAYMLWVDEGINVQGVLMNEDSTWFINKKSNAIFKEILKMKS
ncbi:DUF5301 domain-containing protein [Clostridium folliculivorans]|uniref:YhfM-like domain-containing protein n=1 Tax=Clostridium folliculivorans TaxID=2886038 RepID=A0A9W6DAY2_9CLOT|nr:DUF5301 domain-containing protein [Clostridium folliculivorans]GKU25143.1 hypothetical protein CFOLD11_19690 [Clostridium folliculivorans]GKU31241.1 hypothetical protein CFB3_33480 [Clostridium folliculivorans]